MSAAAPPCLSAGPDGGSRLQVAVVPGAKRTGADGLHDGCLRVRLTAPPVDGKANDALMAWLAAELHLPRRGVRLERGASARRKLLALDAPPEQVTAWLARQLPGQE
ncbi:MAG: DUF167 domain-containing protein [Rubrivivax sp.]|nr:DUF167 domain-containing protein [Rubrivivax sp.]